MPNQIFVNLPVENLDLSIQFFKALGFEFNPQYTDENATCMIITDTIFVMLLVKPFFQGFTDKPIADAKICTEVLTALACASRDEVDSLVEKACAQGGQENYETKDYGFMYQRSFADLDGHIWELFFMEPNANPQGDKQ